jgi:Holliday junction resolvase
MSTNYTAGRAIEYKAVAMLRSKGITAVRTAGSHSEFDVVGIAPSRIYLVQVKKFKKRLGKYDADVQKLIDLRCPDCTHKSLAIWQEGVGWYSWVDLRTKTPMFGTPSLS